MLEYGDRVYHETYKEGYIEDVSVDKEYVYVMFDNYENILVDPLIKIPTWRLKLLKSKY